MTRRALILSVVIALLVGGAIAIGGLSLWNVLRSQRVQAKVDVGQAQAGSEAGVAALNITGEAAAGRSTIDITVKGGSDAIRSAQGSDMLVTPSSRDAALRALCGMRSYRSDPRCPALCGAGGCERPVE